MAKRKPPELGLYIDVVDPQTATIKKGKQEVFLVDDHIYDDPDEWDADGHRVGYRMGEMRGWAHVAVVLRRGMAAVEAARVLRKLAALLERSPSLMNIRQGDEGVFDKAGVPNKSILALDEDYDDFGNLSVPEIFPLPEEQKPDDDSDATGEKSGA